MSRVIRRLFAAACAVLMALSLCSCGATIRIADIFNNGGKSGTEETEHSDNPPSPVGALSWASGDGVIVVDNADDLQERAAKLYESAAEEGVAVEYKNEAFSLDGQTFDCYIGNPASSPFPMYITIYADGTFQEELFISGLLKPGQAFNKVVMSRALEMGTHTLPVCYTQVFEPHTGDNDTDDFMIRAQTVLTLNFNVVDSSVTWDLSE